MAAPSKVLGRVAVGVAVGLVLVSGCSGPGPVLSGGGSGASCGRDAEVVHGLASYASGGGYAVVTATVGSVDEAELVGGRRGVVYTPVQLEKVEPLAGRLDTDRVFLVGGTAEGVGYGVSDGPSAGLVKGSNVLLVLAVEEPGQGLYSPPPDGPSISLAYPVLDDGSVVVTGGCLQVTAGTPSGRTATVPVPLLDSDLHVQNVTEPQGLVPLAVLRAAVARGK